MKQEVDSESLSFDWTLCLPANMCSTRTYSHQPENQRSLSCFQTTQIVVF